MLHLFTVNVLGIFPVQIYAETSVILTVFLLRQILQQNAGAVDSSCNVMAHGDAWEGK
jgi:hypothetical protein